MISVRISQLYRMQERKKKEKIKKSNGMYPEIRKTRPRRPGFNLHQETHYNGREQNSARKSFIVAATPDGGADPP